MLHLSPLITAYILSVTALLGLVMGSFANCLAWRIAHDEDFIHGRSHCAFCGHPLSAKELIPVFSWLFLRGKCLHCGEKLSVRYPLTELLCMMSFIGLVLLYDATPTAIKFMVLTVLLLSIALVDLDTGLIPNQFLIAGILNFLIFSIFCGRYFFTAVATGIFNALVIVLPLFLLVLIMDKVLGKESMGGGDLKLYFVLGLYFDWSSNIFLLLMSSILGLLFFLIFRNHRIRGNAEAIPFGPAIAASGYLCMTIAPFVIQWYMNQFF